MNNPPYTRFDNSSQTYHAEPPDLESTKKCGVHAELWSKVVYG